MKMDEIMECFRQLAQSQGFYGRVYRNLSEMKKNDPEAYTRATKDFESRNWHDPVDMIMDLES